MNGDDLTPAICRWRHVALKSTNHAALVAACPRKARIPRRRHRHRHRQPRDDPVGVVECGLSDALVAY